MLKASRWQVELLVMEESFPLLDLEPFRNGSARLSALTPKPSHIACVDAPSFPTDRPQNSGLSEIAPPRRLPNHGKHIWHHRNGRRVSSRTSLLGIAWKPSVRPARSIAHRTRGRELVEISG